ncbi:putative methyltransferase NSUN7 [Centroberyx affinis]|uniref:putative methyltransferase NSUN7 n=1 Tax=Centroberyx affinis TaxID=166261 RepID=UPI003A5C63BF
MVRKRNSRGLSRRSSACKTTADSQIPSIKDLTLLDGPVHSEIPALPPELLTPGHGQLGFPDSVYLLAAAIFHNTHLEKPAAHRLVYYGKRTGLPLPEVKDEEMQRTAYELAFKTLKYQELLEDIMIDSCFYLAQPMPDDQMSLVAVMLYDFQDRKFLPRERREKEEFVQEVRDVENCLLRFKTKLAASLARCRIKHDLLTIECILPESVKMKQERSSSLPLYTWVNTLKSSLDEVQCVLKGAGFSQVKSIGQLEGQTFCQDPHCGDILVFPAQLKAELYHTKLLSDHRLIIQDKSCILGPNAVCSLISGEGDVLMVGCFSGLTVSHTASLIAVNHKANSKDQSKVYVCVSDRTAAQREELQDVITNMGCKNVKLIPEVFQSLDGGDTRLQKVRVILLTPQCSVSAISNPVEFILQENGDTDLLQDLSQGAIAQSKLEALVALQKKDIDHALKFPNVWAVVYSTCSSYPEENEAVVSKALEQDKARSEQEGEPKPPNFRPSPPGLAEGSEVTGPFFRLEPSDQSNGCFLAVLTREPEPVAEETAQEVLARANGKGLLDRIGSNQPTRKERHGNANRTTKATRTRSSQSHLSINNQSRVNQLRNCETKDSSSATSYGQQGFAKKQLSPRGKAPCLQTSKNTVSSSSSSSKPDHTKPCKSASRVINTATSINGHHLSNPSSSSSASSLHPAPPPSAAVAPPSRRRQEVLRPVALTLPSIHFPNFSPPEHRGIEGNNPRRNYNEWRLPPPAVPPLRSSRSLSKEAVVKPQPWF